MMPGRACFLLVLLWALPGFARSDRPDAPVGLWWAEGGAAQVEIGECNDGLCGTVIWLRSPFDENGCPVRDVRNPDVQERGRSLIGVEILRGLRATESRDGWSGGEIYDPTSGRHYSAAVSLDGADRLRVRGYLGIRLLGRTTTWTRVHGEPVCRTGD
jgi:uncharacterized protein (DUF2147 family)